jgi:hypothetical protein
LLGADQEAHMNLSHLLRTALVVCGLAEAAGCSSTRDAPALTTSTGVVREPIVGGQVCTTCQWPTVVHNPNGDNCTNTLVAPSVIMSAGHCYEAGNNTHLPVAFGENFNEPSTTAQVDKCYLDPGYTGSVGQPSGTDISFCTLKQPITDVPITPILMGCETSILKQGQDVVLVGFGATSANGGEDGRKRFVHVTVDAVQGGTIVVGNASSGACFGDSGGPAFVKLADGTWRVFGATSAGTGQPCRSGSVYTLLHPIVPWLEQTAAVDVTPCFDADGTWNPGPACGRFATDPDKPPSAATWSDGCSAIDLSPTVSATCGANDAGAPEGGVDADAGYDGGNDAASGDSGGSSSGGDDDASSASNDGGSSSTGPAEGDTSSSDNPGTQSTGCRASSMPGSGPWGGALSGLAFVLAALVRRRVR